MKIKLKQIVKWNKSLCKENETVDFQKKDERMKGWKAKKIKGWKDEMMKGQEDRRLKGWKDERPRR